MDIAAHVPASVTSLLERLWSNGHAAYVVGGSLRDTLLSRPAADWDLATDARPDRLLAIFPGSVYENRFGTVAVREGDRIHQITTFRIDHDYADFRRPHRVEFGDRIEDDLARRDFTVNAMAWGADASGAGSEPRLVDPFGGRRDVEARCLRAVGEPAMQFEEDALRMVRGVRLAATLGFEIEPATVAAIGRHADLVGHLSGERIAAELEKLLAADRPSVGLRLLAGTGILAVVSPDLEAQRGIAQNKVEGEDLWDHSVRSVDAAAADRPVVRLAALVHDIGKPATVDDGPFRGHELTGATLAARLLARLRMPRAVSDRVVHLVRQHMFAYEPDWGDAGVRRFIRRVGRDALDDLFALRAADNIGSGLDPGAGSLDDLRRRVDEQLAASAVLERRQLAVSGTDLMSELDLPQGPTLGRILDRLLERVVADPALNDRPTLLLLAASMRPDPELPVIERLLVARQALADGELDQAERLFGQVAEADERNAMAVVGLAEVALARGDQDRAGTLASEALAIDGEEAAARRVLARIAKLRPAEGEPLPPAARPPGSPVGRVRAWLARLLGRA